MSEERKSPLVNTVPHAAQKPTCLTIGWEAYETCTRCDYSTYKELPLEDHMPGEPTKKFEVLPQCESTGHYYLVVECKYCDKELSADYSSKYSSQGSTLLK